MQIKRLDNLSDDNIFQQIALMHERFLSAGVLAKLGSSFLIRLYKSLVDDAHSAVYIAQTNEEVLAFVSCTRNTNKFYKRFLYKNSVPIILALPKLCTPALLKRSFSLLHYLVKKPEQKSPEAELLSIAVGEQSHRSGVGSQLMIKVFDFMKENQIDCFKVTAAYTQEAAHHFYQSKGGVLSESIELGHLKSSVYYFISNKS